MITPLVLATAIAQVPAIETDFETRWAQLPSGLFEVFGDSVMTADEYDAMRFLYAYMPLPDLAGHSADFHLANVRASLKAREEMPWGKNVPEREFLHFVLPVRVNNEVLDLARPEFYDELKERVKGLSMKEAILEVNHWCHEKATYKPSDGRTSSPLSTVSQAIGRCGEESTFGVAALRSVGIPARQVYTPRWAHTDDNHAWVEAWADGEWYFLGACEPAPILDMAWFNAPASRGMLMTTNVIGKYDGPEEKLASDLLNTTINVTAKYAPVGNLTVKVVDRNGHPVEDARVAFSIYNYSDFFPAAVKRSDADGKASLTSGMGDLIVWATDGSYFGFSKGSPKDGKELEIVLDKDMNHTGSFDLEIVPPRGSETLPNPSAEQVAENNRRLQYEDSVRKAYEATFVKEEEAREIARKNNLDEEKFASIIKDSRGNSHKLCALISELEPEKKKAAIALLETVTEKDRRDISTDVIPDCLGSLDNNYALIENPSYVEYVLSPRVDNEHLVPHKIELLSMFGKTRADEFRKDPRKLVDWVKDNIEVETVNNPKRLLMDPLTVYKVKKADPRSRNIFFVAMARTAGIPARIDPVTSKVQIKPDLSAEWIDIKFDEAAPTDTKSPKGRFRMPYRQVGRNVNPRYYSQFSIFKIEGGIPNRLDFDENDGWKEVYGQTDLLDTGQYMLLSGQRMADGSVLAHGEIFTIDADGTTEVPLVLREDPKGVQVIGSLNAENLYQPAGETESRSILSTTGRGYYVLGIIGPGHEPSAHSLNDLSAVAGSLESWGGTILVLFGDEDSASRFDKGHYKSLPANLTFGVDTGQTSLNELKQSLNLPTSDLPIFVIADSFNRVVFAIQGYNIGLGDQILDVLSKIDRNR